LKSHKSSIGDILEKSYEEIVIEYLQKEPDIHPDKIPKQILLLEEDGHLVTKVTIKVESIERSSTGD